MNIFPHLLVLAGLTFQAAVAADPVVLFQDDFEAATDATASYPTIGNYTNFKAAVLPLSDLNSDTVGTAASGNVLQLARSEQLATGHRWVIARLDRPAQSGEHVRLEFDARLGQGKALLFGFGSSAGGIQMAEGRFYTIIVSLSEDGRVGVYDGTKYVKTPDLVVTPGQWQSCTLDFIVGTEELSLRIGENKVMIAGPFAEKVSPVPSVEEIFFSTASDEVTGEFDNVKVSIVENAGLSALPVFGRIVWHREAMPFIRVGPKGGISGVGMCASGHRIFVAGGFLGKGPFGDGGSEPNRKTSKWVYAYNVETKGWERLPDLPSRAEYGRMAAVAGKLYFVGGAAYANDGDRVGPYVPSAAMHVLDLGESAPAWKPMPALPEARTHFALGNVGDLLIAMGGNVYDVAERGYSPRTVRKETAVLDLSAPQNGWTVQASAPNPARGWSATAACRGKLWVFGGLSFQNQGSKSRRVRLPETLSYDPLSDTWTRHTPAPVEISGWGGAAYLDRYVILVGGHGGPKDVKPRMNVIPLVYDTMEDRWLRLEQSVTPAGGDFNDPGVAICQDAIYVAGAEGNGGSHFNHWLIGRIERSN